MAKKHLAVIRKRRATSDRFMLFSRWKRNGGNRREEEPSRWMRIWFSTWKDFKQVFPYLMMGIAIGSFIYGFIPTDLIASMLAKVWYAIPVAAVIGIPLYIRAEAVIPLKCSSGTKGMALGSVWHWSLVVQVQVWQKLSCLNQSSRTKWFAAFLFTVILSMATWSFLYSFIFG